jgi:hypothetical protein
MALTLGQRSFPLQTMKRISIKSRRSMRLHWRVISPVLRKYSIREQHWVITYGFPVPANKERSFNSFPSTLLNVFLFVI